MITALGQRSHSQYQPRVPLGIDYSKTCSGYCSQTVSAVRMIASEAALLGRGAESAFNVQRL